MAINVLEPEYFYHEIDGYFDTHICLTGNESKTFKFWMSMDYKHYKYDVLMSLDSGKNFNLLGTIYDTIGYAYPSNGPAQMYNFTYNLGRITSPHAIFRK